MKQTPDLRVPERRKASTGGGRSGLLFAMLVVLLMVQVLSFFISPNKRPRLPGTRSLPGAASLAPDRQKVLAQKLENINLPEQAADAWETYLTMADPDPFEAGSIRFRLGKLRQAGGEYQAAIAQYFLAEELLAGSSSDLKHDIDLGVTECLRRLGQYADLAREVSARATDDEEGSLLEGQQVVAQIGDEKITVVEFDRLLTDEIEMVVQSRLGLNAEEEDALRRRAHQQFADPRVRAQQLQQIIASRVLADEARKQGLHESEAFRERLTAVADGILASALLFQEVGKRATVTDADVERYYGANVDQFADPPATFIAHILCRDEEHARAVTERLQAGESFDKLVKEESLDSNTRETLGILAAPVLEQGDYVPLFGANAELHDSIRQVPAGGILDEPQESDRGWHVIKIVSHRERVEKPLDEIREDVKHDTVAARRREVTDQYMRELFEDAGVRLYPEVFLSKGRENDEDQSP